MEIGGDQTLFIYWLRHLPWDDEQRARLDATLWQYCVGGWKDGRVVFWMIDHTGVPRAAKLMRYLEDGHRDKTAHPGWIYNQDGCRQKLNPDEHTVLKPLFGSHLLTRYSQAVVNIVESEKTAIIMANYYGNNDTQIWMACGGLQWLQLDKFQPLIDQGRTIWLWPDKDGREAWQEVCDKLGYERCHVYTHFFDICWCEADGDKADVADIAIRMMRTGDKPRHTDSGKGATEQSATASDQSGASPAPVVWNTEEPFVDPEELKDPRVREWRERMSRVHSAGWSSWPKSRVDGVKTVGEVMAEHPLLSKLL